MRMPILEGKDVLASALLAVCILLAAEGRAGAAGNGHSRVRHFPGVVTFPVVKRAARGVLAHSGPPAYRAEAHA